MADEEKKKKKGKVKGKKKGDKNEGDAAAAAAATAAAEPAPDGAGGVPPEGFDPNNPEGVPPDQYMDPNNPYRENGYDPVYISKVAEYLYYRTQPPNLQSLMPIMEDPRTGLRIIRPNAEYETAFAELTRTSAEGAAESRDTPGKPWPPGVELSAGQPGVILTEAPDDQIILHVFEEVELIGPITSGPPEPAVLMVTDQTFFICTRDGECMHAIEVDQIGRLDMGKQGMTTDADTLGVQGPEWERDFILRFKRGGFGSPADEVVGPDGEKKPLSAAEQEQLLRQNAEASARARNDASRAIMMIYKRMTNGKTLPYDLSREIDKENTRTDTSGAPTYKLEVPYGHEPKTVPQRTKGHLRKQLENFEKQQYETFLWVRRLQAELDAEHRLELTREEKKIANVQEQVDDLERIHNAQNAEIKRLQSLREARGVGVVGGTDAPKDEYDMRMHDLERRILELREELEEPEADPHNFTETGIEPVEVKKTRPRGNSLHMQGLLEVLSHQVVDRNDDLTDMRAQLEEIDQVRADLKNKDREIEKLKEQIKELGMQEDEDYDPDAEDAIEGFMDFDQRYDSAVDALFRQRREEELEMQQYEEEDDDLESDEEPIPQFEFQPFEPEEFERFLPDRPEDITHHPITGLKIVDVPQQSQFFAELKDVVMHQFVYVRKFGKEGRSGASKPRVLVISESCVYLCKMDESILYCAQIGDIEAIYLDNQLGAGFKVRGESQPGRERAWMDLFLDYPSDKERRASVNILQTIQRALAPPRECKATMLGAGDRMHKKLNLKRPQAHELHLRKVLTKEALWQKLKKKEEQHEREHLVRQQQRQQVHLQNELRRKEEHERYYRELRENTRAAKRDLKAQRYASAYTRTPDLQEILEAIKQDLRQEFRLKRDTRYQKLKEQQLALQYETDLKTRELEDLNEHWRHHRCEHTRKQPRIPIAPNTGGMYWLPGEAIEIECCLEVLKAQFWDSVLVTSHANGFLNVWDVESGELLRTLKDHTGKVVAFQYDGVELISGSYDSTIRRWNIAEGTCINVIAAHRGQVTCLQFDASILISGSSDTTLQVWQIDVELRHLQTLKGHKSTVVDLRFEDDVLVSVEWGWVFLWDLEEGIISRTLRDENGGIRCVDYQGHWLVTGSDGGTLTVWDVQSGEYEHLHGHDDDITNIQIEDDYAVTSSTDCTIRIWDLAKFKHLGIFNNSYPKVATGFQIIAHRFVAVEENAVKIWTK